MEKIFCPSCGSDLDEVGVGESLSVSYVFNSAEEKLQVQDLESIEIRCSFCGEDLGNVVDWSAFNFPI